MLGQTTIKNQSNVLCVCYHIFSSFAFIVVFLLVFIISSILHNWCKQI